MKIKDSTLRQIIREEYARLINEAEEEMSETEALDGIVKANRGPGAEMVKIMRKAGAGKIERGALKGIVKAYGLNVSSEQKRALGL